MVPSFGGASADSADEEIADSCHRVSAIAGQYEKVITAYHVSRLDLDTEEDSLNNYAGIDRRNKAIAMVEEWARQTHDKADALSGIAGCNQFEGRNPPPKETTAERSRFINR